MTSLRNLKRNWEGLAQADPLWAICSDPAKRHGKWNWEEFLATGVAEVDTVLSYLKSVGLHPDPEAPVLDFGCGVGRLTAALSRSFSSCWGVDISPSMVQQAARHHQQNSRCRFLLNETDGLPTFAGNYFGFIYTSIVLQHVKSKYVKNYLAEFLRVLKPGGILVFQIADSHRRIRIQRLRNFLGVRRRLNRLTGRNGSGFRMDMHCLSEDRIRQFLAGRNARIVDVQLTNSTECDFDGNLKFLKEAPTQGYVSKQYCVVKRD